MEIVSMKWISDLNLTRKEKALSVALISLMDTDMAPTIGNIGNYSIYLLKRVLKDECLAGTVFFLEMQHQDVMTTLTDKINGLQST